MACFLTAWPSSVLVCLSLALILELLPASSLPPASTARVCPLDPQTEFSGKFLQPPGSHYHSLPRRSQLCGRLGYDTPHESALPGEKEGSPTSQVLWELSLPLERRAVTAWAHLGACREASASPAMSAEVALGTSLLTHFGAKSQHHIQGVAKIEPVHSSSHRASAPQHQGKLAAVPREQVHFGDHWPHQASVRLSLLSFHRKQHRLGK